MTITFTEIYNHQVNRKGWPAGPWDGEPDKLAWVHQNGALCLIVRNGMGAWCGYVGVPENISVHGVDYWKVDTGECEVEGGLTYSGRNNPTVGHRNGGEGVWWLGFDCCHSFNYYPGDTRAFASPSHDDVSRYVTKDQVIAMVNAMAESVNNWSTYREEV